jgi:hypothetical protein
VEYSGPASVLIHEGGDCRTQSLAGQQRMQSPDVRGTRLVSLGIVLSFPDHVLTCSDPMGLQIGQVSDVTALHAKL